MTTVRFERDGAIGNLVLADPPFNRVDSRFAETLRAAVHQASESDIRVLVIRSEGPHFSFGGGDRLRRRFRAGIGVRFSCRGRKCDPSLRRSHDSDAADRRSPAADR